MFLQHRLHDLLAIYQIVKMRFLNYILRINYIKFAHLYLLFFINKIDTYLSLMLIYIYLNTNPILKSINLSNHFVKL